MRFLATLLCGCLLAWTAFAQAPIKKLKGITGNFYVSVDDRAKIFVDGKLVHEAELNESRSPELELSAGQHVVVHLDNALGGRRFMLAFVAKDRSRTISFRRRDFRIVPDLDVTDFTTTNFSDWNKLPNRENQPPKLPVKNHSEWLWGNSDRCILACTITSDMIEQFDN